MVSFFEAVSRLCPGLRRGEGLVEIDEFCGHDVAGRILGVVEEGIGDFPLLR
jgi:hypothetical protein